MALVHVDGKLYDEDDALVSVFDHGLVVGDAVFETILLHRSRPFALTRHVARLARSARGLGLEAAEPNRVEDAVAEVVASARFPTGRIRVTLTAGRGPLGSGRLGSPTSLIVAASPDELSEEACALSVVPWTRNERGALAGLKTTSYAENALALAWAHERGGDEAIFANTVGALCEGTGSNVFVVLDGELVTPPLTSGCLAGITRELVLERHGGVERDVAIGDFRAGRVSEAFLTSSIRCVQPVAAIDAAPLEAPGPETSRAMATFADLLAGDIDP